MLDIQFNYLTGMASYMGEREDLFCQENKRLIQSIVKEQDLDLIGIMKQMEILITITVQERM